VLLRMIGGVSVEPASDRVDGRRAGMSSWVHLVNLATVALISLLALKTYNVAVKVYRWLTAPHPDLHDLQTILVSSLLDACSLSNSD